MIKNKDKAVKVIVLGLITMMWMVVIFILSARTADESTEDSNRVGMFIGRILVRGFDELPEAEKLAYAEKIEYPVRKTAHAAEYAVLAILSFASITALCGVKGRVCPEKGEESAYNGNSGSDDGKTVEKSGNGDNRDCDAKGILSNKPAMLLAWGWAVVYACTDEIHQLFVPGRSGQLTDVLIDGAGAGLGILCCVLLRMIWAGRMKKKGSQ